MDIFFDFFNLHWDPNKLGIWSAYNYLCGATVVELFKDSGQFSVLAAIKVQLAQLGHRFEPQSLVLRVSQRILHETKQIYFQQLLADFKQN